MKIMHAVGARPNFMKAAPLIYGMAERPELFRQTLVHTGQHYDDKMSEAFFVDLELPRPDVYLGVGSGSHAEQTARVLLAFEEKLLEERPDWLVVFGDVNSTLACALTAAKLGIRTAHVEAGLRSFDRTMPEELNRILTDQLSDLLFTTEEAADRNLAREGIEASKVHRVGNLMIDTLVRLLPKAEKRFPRLARELGIDHRGFVLVTLHRPFNVDEERQLRSVMGELSRVASRVPVVFPAHPRSGQRLERWRIEVDAGVRMLEPLGYLDFLSLEAHAALVLTDSGGIQEETTYLGVPCLTLRPNTERPVTIEIGTNRLASFETPLAEQVFHRLDRPAEPSGPRRPELWDGRAAARIVEVFERQNQASAVLARPGASPRP